jgi:hypothetical protein
MHLKQDTTKQSLNYMTRSGLYNVKVMEEYLFAGNITNKKLWETFMVPTYLQTLKFYSQASMNYKLIIIQFGSPFLCIIFSSTDSHHIKFVKSNSTFYSDTECNFLT